MKLTNPFIPQKDYKAPRIEVTPREKVVLVFHCMQEHLAEADEKDPTKFLTVKKAVVEQKIPLREYIQQFDREVDLKEQINRMHTQAEFDEFISRTGLPSNKEVFIQKDYMSDLEIENLIERGNQAWNSLDESLKAGRTKEEFLKDFNVKELEAFVNARVEAVKAKAETKEGEQNA